VQAVAVEGGSSAAGIHPDNQTPLLKKLSALNLLLLDEACGSAKTQNFNFNEVVIVGFVALRYLGHGKKEGPVVVVTLYWYI
jgi:hypothetical protein